jgi:hypothetical protein
MNEITAINMNKIFCSFADSRNKKSLKRIERQVKNLAFFDLIYTYNESRLDENFRLRYQTILLPSVRGFGYWVWKPQVIKQTMALANYGDIILYADAGCHLRVEGIDKLVEYFEILANSSSFIMATELPIELLEKNWTKGDLFEYFNCISDPSVTHSAQIQATVIFIKKTRESERFIDQWSNVFETNIALVDDSPSNTPNFDGFVDHRHDQSIFSLLCKRTEVVLIPDSDIYRIHNWSELDTYPIWAMRDLDTRKPQKKSLFRRIKKFIKKRMGL